MRMVVETIAENITIIAEIMLAVFLVVLNGFFVASEFAFVRMRESSIESMADDGAFASGVLMDVLDELDIYLAVTQLGITIASLALGWVGEPAVAELIEVAIGERLTGSTLHLVSFTIGFSVITFLHVVFGELAPKTLSIQRTENVAQLVAYPMKLFRYLFIPGIIVFNGAANKATSLIGIEPAGESGESYSEREIRSVLSESGKQGQVDKEEVEMIERVFQMDDMKVKEIMVPRPDVTTLERDSEISEVMEKVQDRNHTRYPVVEDDEIVGYVDIKDVFQRSETNGNKKRTVNDIMDDIEVVPESASVKKALKNLQDSEIQMAGVIDEWGVFEGIVTVEDTVEVVVGDLRDKYDTGEFEPSVDDTESGYISDGSLSVNILNNKIDTNFNEDDIDTVAGLIMSETEDVPDVGAKVDIDDYTFEVMEKQSDRIKEVKISNGIGDEDNSKDNTENETNS